MASNGFTLQNTTVPNAYGVGLRIIGSRAKVAGNRFLQTAHTAIYVAAAIKGRPLSEVRITDNVLDRSGEPVDAMLGACISVHAQHAVVDDVLVSRNICRLPVPSAYVDHFDKGADPPYFWCSASRSRAL